ncbi:hypothetical protein BDW22DRAFT_597947 [Trametopsis cervina]|nr:hypothetical protein BDW22DRAFT_597947 [Trametopsis cervina]
MRKCHRRSCIFSPVGSEFLSSRTVRLSFRCPWHTHAKDPWHISININERLGRRCEPLTSWKRMPSFPCHRPHLLLVVALASIIHIRVFRVGLPVARV